jgi:FOG: TPR repeat, SEL1 subfamily
MDFRYILVAVIAIIASNLHESSGRGISFFSRTGEYFFWAEYFLAICILAVSFYKKKYFKEIAIALLVVFYFSNGFMVYNRHVFTKVESQDCMISAIMVKKEKRFSTRIQSAHERQAEVILDENGKYGRSKSFSVSPRPIEDAISYDRILSNEKVVLRGQENPYLFVVSKVEWLIEENPVELYEAAKKEYLLSEKEEAFAIWLQLAQGEPSDPRAAYQVGLSYLYGDGAEKDSEKAKYWLDRTAKAGVRDRISEDARLKLSLPR